MEISLTSLGSSHTFLSPQSRTEAASRFCSFNDTMVIAIKGPPRRRVATLSRQGAIGNLMRIL